MSTNWDWGIFQCPQDRIGVKIYVHIYGYIIEAVGVHPVHFGIMMVVNLAIGFVTPPIGVNLFVASSLTDIPVMKVASKAMPMIAYFLLALLLLTFVPGISMAFL